MASIFERFIIGPTENPIYTFEGDQIVPTTKGVISVSLPGEELAYDTLTFRIRSETSLTIPYGTAITYYAGERLIGKFYKKEMTHSDDIYTINAMSAIGILDRQYHKGGVYKNVPLNRVIDNVIRGVDVPKGYTQYKRITKVGGPRSITTDVSISGHVKFVIDAYVGEGIFGNRRLLDYDNGAGIGERGTKCELAIYKPADEYLWKFSVGTSINYEELDRYHTYLASDGIPVQEDKKVRIIARAEWNSGEFSIDGVASSQYTNIPPYGGPSRPIVIFPDTSSLGALVGIERLKIYAINDGAETLRGDFVPAVQQSTGMCGLYNITKDTFCSSGTTPSSGYYFIYGELPAFDEFDYEIDPQLNDVNVTGWLPYDTKRNNLHQLLIANNIYILRQNNGHSKFTFLKSGEHEHIPSTRVLIGGNVGDAPEVTNITLSSHLFRSDITQDPVTLFDNTETGVVADNQTVKFGTAPIIDSTILADGLSLVEVGANYAIVSGTGKLTGVPYIHTTKDYAAAVGGVGEPQEVEVSDCTMINNQNASYVLQKLINYYANSRHAQNRIIVDGEICGAAYEYNRRGSETIAAYMKKMSYSVTSMIGADCELAADFIPVGFGNAYTHVAVLTGSGTWSVPQDVFDKDQPLIKAVLISGGQGGQTALKGGNGGLAQAYDTAGEGGTGGEQGQGGNGGRIKETGDIDCTNITSFSYSCGTGGAAGSSATGTTHVNGQNGTDTTFGTFTTSGAQPSAAGYYEELTGITYGKHGVEGVKGGDGQSGEYDSVAEDVTYKNRHFSGGGGGFELYQNEEFNRHAGGGSGAAAGKDGSRGGAEEEEFFGNQYFWIQGYGADGVNAVAADAPSVFGCGGNGGNGGSGAGGASIVERDHVERRAGGRTIQVVYRETPSYGGFHGAPSAGAPGCILVYY